MSEQLPLAAHTIESPVPAVIELHSVRCSRNEAFIYFRTILVRIHKEWRARESRVKI